MTEKQNTRTEDERLEKVISNYLDKNLYLLQNGFNYFQRNTSDTTLQFAGVDVAFSLKDDFNYADEKMATSYINKDLQTFSMELRTLNKKGSQVEGWFVNSSQINTHYVLGFITASKDKFINEEDIKAIEIVIIEKKKLLQYVSKYFDINRSEEIYQEFVKGKSVQEVNSELKLNTDKNGFIVFFSSKLREKPMNLLIKKEIYVKLADKHLYI